MNPYIIQVTPFTIAGWPIRIKMPNVSRHADIPAFSYTELFKAEEQNQMVGKNNRLKELFAKSNATKHCETYMCYDADLSKGEFTYFFGRGLFFPEDIEKIIPGMVSVVVSGLYAIFSSPLISVEQNDIEVQQVIKDLWNDIMFKWLPDSEFEFDETRKDFEHYDLRSHRQFYGGKKQMDIFIPISQREDAYQEAKKKGRIFIEDDIKLNFRN